MTAISRICFTLSHGILNEIYYPTARPCLHARPRAHRDRRARFLFRRKAHAEHQIKSLASGIPAYDLVNTHAGHYRITKRIVSDPYRDVVLQRLTFEALSQTGGRYRVYALLAPHLVNAGAGNTAWLGEYKGVPMLFAQGRGTALAMACTVPWRNASAGFVGYSDGWQMLSRNGKLDPIWTRRKTATSP